MKTVFISLLIFLNFFSCQTDKYKLIDNDGIKSAFITNSSPTFKGYYYMGTDANFHYFESRWDFQKDRFFKLQKTDLKVIKPFYFKQKELRIDLHASTNINFGENEFYTLNIVEN